jgi:predicted TIM-barrel fold metal-dependent hydrolase
MPLEPPLFTEGLSQPPVRRYGGPIVDAHCHVDDVEDARLLLRVAGDFGVRVLCAVSRPPAIAALKRALGDAYQPIVRIDHSTIADPSRFSREGVRAVREARALGTVGAKFWYAPRWQADAHFRFDNPALSPIFEALAELGMVALVHIADPDCWFAGPYADRSRYGTKAQQYEQLERTLTAFPRMKVQGAHFGGDPEHLDHIGRLLDAYPNYSIDCSATKWMARELSGRAAEARAFIIQRADRLLFGSDLVAFKGARAEDYSSRYWVHRWLWEGEGVRPSPVPDPCATAAGGPTVTGLSLPDDVLARLYTENARRWFGIEV